MDLASGYNPFPIPVVADIGPGSQAGEDDLQYLTMPKGMETYRPPILPEIEEIVENKGAILLFQNVLDALTVVNNGGNAKNQTVSISLDHVNDADRVLINQVLGEGEVSAQVRNADGNTAVKIQEAVFTGVWRVFEYLDDGLVRDSIEVGSVPEILRQVARSDGECGPTDVPPIPPMHNIPSLLVELEDQRKHWTDDQMAYVVNLTLLPVTVDEIGYLDMQLGTGRAVILSRGYGNCRITNCCVPNTWRVVYYNSQDSVILNSVEVTSMPEVVCAAPEDLQDSEERLREVLQWMAHE